MGEQLNKQYFIYLGVYLLLLILAILLPFLQVIFLMLLPLPLILIAQMYDRNKTILAMLFMGIGAMLIFPVLSIPLTLIALISGGMIGFSIRQKHHPYETWAKGTAGFTLSLALVYAYVEVVLNISIMDTFRNTMNDSLAMTEELFQSFGIEEQADLDTLKDQMMLYFQLLPVIIVVFSMVLSIVTQWLSYKWLNKRQEANLYFPPFSSLKLPKIMLWIYFIALLATFFVAIDYSTPASVVIHNIFQLLGILMALQGLSFVFFYADKKGSRTKALPIISILVLIFFPIMGLYLMRILGIIDLGFDMRKRMAK